MSKLYPGNDRFCRVIAPEHHLALADAGQCKWPQRRITYSELLILNGMARDDVKATFDLAWKQWADVCDIEPVRLPPLDVMKPATASVAFANVAATQGPIDGPWGTLAYSYLPCGVAKDSQLTQKYDNGETWTRDYFLACACHEIGHALGLNHLDVGNLMAPILDPNITKPQPGDVAEILARYGPPATAPTPVPCRHLRLRPSPTTWRWMGRGDEYTLDPGKEVRFAFRVPGRAWSQRTLFTVTARAAFVPTVTLYGRLGKSLLREPWGLRMKLYQGEYSVGIQDMAGQGGPFQMAAKLG
jgi:hypothetical protein